MSGTLWMTSDGKTIAYAENDDKPDYRGFIKFFEDLEHHKKRRKNIFLRLIFKIKSNGKKII